MTARPAAGGGRWVEVAPSRLRGWLDGFVERHGRAEVTAVGGDSIDLVRLRAADGAVAECRVPFPPLAGPSPDPGPADDEGETPDAAASRDPADPLDLLVAHANRERRVGVLLVRLGGHAAGVFDGDRLVASKVGARLVHGRSAAGGWSQHRFARRRDKQAGEALRAAGDVAARVLGPHAERLDAVIVGGDRRAVDALRPDPRLTRLFALETEPFLTVPDPRLAVLKASPAQFRVIRIRVIDPA